MASTSAHTSGGRFSAAAWPDWAACTVDTVNNRIASSTWLLLATGESVILASDSEMRTMADGRCCWAQQDNDDEKKKKKDKKRGERVRLWQSTPSGVGMGDGKPSSWRTVMGTALPSCFLMEVRRET